MSLAAIRDILDRAAGGGRTIAFWWRDDDAVAASPALERLLDLAGRFGVPAAIAAIPAELQPSLPERLRDAPGCRILVHGLAHRNHAPPGRKPAELGEDRPLSALVSDAEAALLLAENTAADALLPILVPPWNRIAPALPATLPPLGYRGLSAFGPRRPMPGLTVVNTHLDLVDWRGSRSAVEPGALAHALSRALEGPHPEPVGLLTHHLVFDEALWRLTADLVALLVAHPAVLFPALDALWAPNGVIEL